MKIIINKIPLDELKKMSEKMFGGLVKAVVDIEMHSDLEELMLANDSQQQSLWGINIHPNELHTNWIEFDSMINIRPAIGNRSRSVENQKIQNKIIEIVTNLVQK